jgi:thymidylate synthase
MNIQARFKIDYNDSHKANDDGHYNSINNVIFQTRKTNRNLSTFHLIQQRQIQKKQFYNKVLEAYKKKIEHETNNKMKEYSLFDKQEQEQEQEQKSIYNKEFESNKNEDDILSNFSLFQGENIEIPIIDLLEQEEQDIQLDILGDTWEIESTKSEDTETDIIYNITDVIFQDKIL